MAERAPIVLDVGKTLSKLSLWTSEGQLQERRTRANHRDGTLDTAGIEGWIEATLREFSGLAHVGSLIPVGHGAAAVVLRDGKLVQAPLDYEAPIPERIRAKYEALRDPFPNTGSPALPLGLNLGAQLFYQVSLHPTLFTGRAMVLPWPQYWSRLLSGVAASEVTSLGCHTDLWNPLTGSHSDLPATRSTTQHKAPLKSAGAILGPLLPQWASHTGQPPDTQFFCGFFASNAVLFVFCGF